MFSPALNSDCEGEFGGSTLYGVKEEWMKSRRYEVVG